MEPQWLPMANCRQYLCEDCGDWLIHQGGRKINESASPFGQWIHDKLPRKFTSGDVDQYIRKWERIKEDGERVLLRWLEHKSPGQKFQDAQKKALIDFDLVIRHAIHCPNSPLQLHPSSGVYIVFSSFEDGEPTKIRVERLDDDRIWEPTADELGLWIPRTA